MVSAPRIGILLTVASLGACQALLDLESSDRVTTIVQTRDPDGSVDVDRHDGSTNDGTAEASIENRVPIVCPARGTAGVRCTNFDDAPNPIGTFEKLEVSAATKVAYPSLDGTGNLAMDVVTGQSDASDNYGFLLIEPIDATAVECQFDWQFVDAPKGGGTASLVTLLFNDGTANPPDAHLAIGTNNDTRLDTVGEGVPVAGYAPGWNHAVLKFAGGSIKSPVVSVRVNGAPEALAHPAAVSVTSIKIGPNYVAGGWHLRFDNVVCTYSP